MRRVVVTGFGVVSCLGIDPFDFYNALLSGKSGARSLAFKHLKDRICCPIIDFEKERFLSRSFLGVDNAIAYGVAAGKLAADHSRYHVIDPNRCGVVIGMGLGALGLYMKNVQKLSLGGRFISPLLVPRTSSNSIGFILSKELGYRGPSYAISSSCTTSIQSIASAVMEIKSGRADAMIAGGVDAPLEEVVVSSFHNAGILSNHSSRPWDRDRDGCLLADGGGALFLEELQMALARGAEIFCEVKGFFSFCDGRHLTSPILDGSGAAIAMEGALKDGKLSTGQIDYISAHATSTPIGDISEIRGIKKVFGKKTPMISAIKSSLGHAIGGAGAIEVIATLLAMKRGVVMPTINSKNLEEEAEGCDLLLKKRDHKIENAMVNSFGFGGSNCVIILSHYAK